MTLGAFLARADSATHRRPDPLRLPTLKPHGIPDASARQSCEGILDIEGLELPKIAIVRVERTNAVLEQDRRDVPIGYEVSANRDVPDDMGIGSEEALPFGYGPRVGQREQRRDVAKGLARRQGCRENFP